MEASELALDFEKRARVADRRCDFESVADDAGVGRGFVDLFRGEACDFDGIEMSEHSAIGVAFLEDGGPAEARLGAFEDEEFEKGAVVVDGDAPFVVVVVEHEWVGAGPGAAGLGRHGSEVECGLQIMAGDGVRECWAPGWGVCSGLMEVGVGNNFRALSRSIFVAAVELAAPWCNWQHA